VKEEIIAMVRNKNLSNEEITELAYLLLKEVHDKTSSEVPTCFLCGGDREYMGNPCDACD